MIGRFLGRPVAACGFSIGFERLVEILEEREGSAALAPPRRKLAVLVDAQLGDLTSALDYARAERARGAVVVVEPKSAKSFGRQLYQLAKDGFREGRAYDRDGAVQDIGPQLEEKSAEGGARG
jgi:histidyl-tRNA synthetase